MKNRIPSSPLSMQHLLEKALRHNDIVPYLQPIVCSKKKIVIGCEILARWQHPTLGSISPEMFIPLIEKREIIISMTRELMHEVRVVLAPLAYTLPEKFHFSLNITAQHCELVTLIQDCKFFTEAFSDNPITLTLEITEREIIPKTPMSELVFKQLSKLGVMIAIDDFGVGYSNLGYLQEFNFDIVKIDKSFIRSIGIHSISEHIIASIVSLSAKLNMLTIAEGVENQSQADILKKLNVDYLQGYYYGHPVPVKSFIAECINR
jgi:EAL domain-containing protein (putative c-di-GMP-specific phosphodiesterase class I)